VWVIVGGAIGAIVLGAILGAFGTWLKLGGHTTYFKLGTNLIDMKGNNNRIYHCYEAGKEFCKLRIEPTNPQ